MEVGHSRSWRLQARLQAVESILIGLPPQVLEPPRRKLGVAHQDHASCCCAVLVLLVVGLRLLLLLRLLSFRLLRCWLVIRCRTAGQPHLMTAGVTAIDHLSREADPTNEHRRARAAFTLRWIGDGH